MSGSRSRPGTADNRSGAAVAGFLRHLEVERRVAANTLEAYRRDLSRLEAHAARRGTSPVALTRADLEAFVRETMASGLAPASTARLVAAVRGFYRFQRLVGAVSVNPAEDLEAPRLFAALPRFLSLDDVDRLLEAPDVSTPRGVRDRALIEVLYATGLRVSELVGLRLTDLHPDQGYLQCAGQRAQAAHRAARRDGRRVGAAVSRRRPADLISRRDGPWVFVNARGGTRLSRSGFWKLLKAHGRTPGFARTSVRMCSGIPSRRTCSSAAPTCAPSSRCSATPTSRPRRSTRTCSKRGSGMCTTRFIRDQAAERAEGKREGQRQKGKGVEKTDAGQSNLFSFRLLSLPFALCPLPFALR